VERKLGEFVAKGFDSLIVGEEFATVKARKGLRARDGFEIEDDGVLAQMTSGLGRHIVSLLRDLSPKSPVATLSAQRTLLVQIQHPELFARLMLQCHACGSAWKRDPVSGVIGVE
jgi:hypothetical protein